MSKKSTAAALPLEGAADAGAAAAAAAAQAAPPPPAAPAVKAVAIKPFSGCKDGELHPTRFQDGDEVTGDLARVAIAEGWAKKA